MIENDVVELIRSRVNLKEHIPMDTGQQIRGNKSGKICCPFHDENTPSCSIHEQYYYCFGCGTKGDIFEYVMQSRGLSFPEALEFLGQQYDVEIPKRHYTPEQRQLHDHKETLYTTILNVWRFFSANLQGSPAVEFLAKRGIDLEVAAEYGAGYAPPRNGLRALIEKGICTTQSLQDLKLLKKTDDGRWYDHFQHQVVFPLYDRRGRIVGFNGRRLNDEGQGPKYKLSEESPIFDKQGVVFGLLQSAKHARKDDLVFGVEGMFDVLCMSQRGYKNTVTPLGCYWSDSQIQQVGRHTKNLVWIPDGDKAGRKSILANLPVFLENGMVPRIWELPDGEDPDSYCATRTKDVLDLEAKGAVKGLDWWMTHIEEQVKESPSQAKEARRGFVQWVKGLDDPMEQHAYGQVFCEALDVPSDVFQSYLSNTPLAAKTEPDVLPDKKFQREQDPYRNFRGDQDIYKWAGVEVDIVPIVPERPEAVVFPPTPYDILIEAVQDQTQAPWVLCAQSVLAAIVFSVQHIADVSIPGIGGKKARRPVSNYFLTIAESGERKSSVDGIVLDGIYSRQLSLERQYKKDRQMYDHKMMEWEAKCKEVRKDILSGRNGVSWNDMPEEPKAPREPVHIIKDSTAAGIFRSLKDGQYSQGMFNDEGGAYIGGWGMSEDQRMATGAMLNNLWGASELDRQRAKEREKLRGRRFSVHIMVQPKASDQLTGDGMLQDLGYTARFLMAEPTSRVGDRPYKEADEVNVRVCEEFGRIVKQRLGYNEKAKFATDTHGNPICDEWGSPIIEDDGIDPDLGLQIPTLHLSDNAKQAWIEFYNDVERKMKVEYSSIRGFASKAAEHCIRLAGAFTLFGNPAAHEINKQAIIFSINLMRYYLSQQIRLNMGHADKLDEDAQALVDWIEENWNESFISTTDISQLAVPHRLRKRDLRKKVIAILCETGYLVPHPEKVEIRGYNRKQPFFIPAKQGKKENLS
jgi:DNA primase catalytic core